VLGPTNSFLLLIVDFYGAGERVASRSGLAEEQHDEPYNSLKRERPNTHL
jgi:hypothetical protein